MTHIFRLLRVLIPIVLTVGACTAVLPGTSQRLLVPVTEQFFAQGVMRLPAQRTDKFVVLTIDDAPSSYTDAILDLLAEYEVKATFFVHTEQINDAPRRAAMTRMGAQGHEIAHHMPRDQSAATYDRAQFDALFRVDFVSADLAINAYGDAAVPYFRPPQGWYDDALMDPTLTLRGYDRPLAALGSDRRYILASFIPWDAGRGKTDHPDKQARNEARGNRYARQLVGNLYPGAIVIFHDGEEDGRGPRAETTLVSLRTFLAGAKAKGYKIVPLSDGIARSGDPAPS